MHSTTQELPRIALPASARTVFAFLSRLRHGSLRVKLPDGSERRFGTGAPEAAIELANWSACADALRDGDIGFAESYIVGNWSTPCLPTLMTLLLRNRRDLESLVYGSAWGRLFARARHLFNRNTRRGSRRNIEAHYDLGNDFYSLWLDPTMNYSSAWFGADPAQPLEQAQRAKMRRALVEAGVHANTRLLEIGCGWGALADMATADFGARVTGVTLSHEQLAYARQRLGGRHADMRLQDYRDITDGPYDAICSVEMVEAVGREYWPEYFATVASLLRSGGRACIQSIVIEDELWPRYVQGSDFIQRYIFPGGCLPCPRQFEAHAGVAGLRVEQRLSFGRDYAHTLRLWRQRFVEQRAQVHALGFDDKFMRLWDFYLCYCEAAFECGNVDVVQYTLVKP